MRPLELILIAVDFLTLAALFWRDRPGWVNLLPGLALLVLVAHLLLEKSRWQMIPLYVLTAALFLLVFPTAFRTIHSPHRVWPVLVGLLLLALFSLPPVLFPVPNLPKPTGPYQVGTSTFYWVDSSRTEKYNNPPGGPRRIMAQVWYPAAPQPGAYPSPYITNLDVAGPALAKELKLPAFVLSHIGLARTHSYSDAPAASGGPFPVLVFSHGWNGFRAQNTYQMEELASHGYIVFAADHTYGAAVTVFPDGTAALNNPQALAADGTPDEEYDQVARKLGQTFVSDIRFVLDQAAKVNQGEIQSALAGKLDLNRVGVFGHSTGGGAAVEICSTDPRCKAGLSEDAWLVPYSREMTQQGLRVPFMYLQSQLWTAKRNPPLFEAVYKNSTGDRYRVKIMGSAHYDFSDVPLLTPLAALIHLKGPIEGRRMLTITNAYTQAFFDHYLKGLPIPLLDGQNENYSEVEFERR